MPEKSKANETQAPKQGLGPFGVNYRSDLDTLQLAGFNTMTGIGTAWVETLSDMGSEVLSFIADRVKEDVKMQHEIMHCDDVTKLHSIQTQFMKKAIEQYTAETGKLVAMSQNFFPTPDDTKK